MLSQPNYINCEVITKVVKLSYVDGEQSSVNVTENATR